MLGNITTALEPDLVYGWVKVPFKMQDDDNRKTEKHNPHTNPNTSFAKWIDSVLHIYNCLMSAYVSSCTS